MLTPFNPDHFLHQASTDATPFYICIWASTARASQRHPQRPSPRNGRAYVTGGSVSTRLETWCLSPSRRYWTQPWRLRDATWCMHTRRPPSRTRTGPTSIAIRKSTARPRRLLSRCSGRCQCARSAPLIAHDCARLRTDCARWRCSSRRSRSKSPTCESGATSS